MQKYQKLQNNRSLNLKIKTNDEIKITDDQETKLKNGSVNSSKTKQENTKYDDTLAKLKNIRNEMNSLYHNKDRNLNR